MKLYQYLALILASLFTVTACQAQEMSICQGPVITMSAVGEIESLPDVAEVLLNVKSEAKDEVTALQNL